MRTAYAVLGQVAGYSQMKVRKKKPFNAMLGETFEYVTKDFRYLAEKVMHVPDQITTFELEAHDYSVHAYGNPKNKFHFNYGSGCLEFNEPGFLDVIYKKHNEWITITKPSVKAKNIIWGGLYVDLEG